MTQPESERRRFTEDEIRELIQSREPVLIPWQTIRPWKEQPRKYINKGRLKALTGSILAGEQCNVIKVVPVHGDDEHQFKNHRRRAAVARLHGQRPAGAVLGARLPSIHARHRDAILSNFNRDDHTPLEIMAALERVRFAPDITRLPKGEQIQAVADTFGRSTQWVIQYLNLAKLPRKILNEIRSGRGRRKKRLPLSVAFRLADLPPEELGILWKTLKRKGHILTAHTQRQIDRIILKKGLSSQRRGRRPSDELRLMEGFLMKTEHSLHYLRDLSDDELTGMLLPRPVAERELLLERLGSAMESMDHLRRRLSAANETSKLREKK